MIKEACNILKAEGVVVIPTETVYGIAADVTSDEAIAKIYTLKNRPKINPLILHVKDLNMAEKFAHFCEKSLKVAKHFWEKSPAPLTLVLKHKKNISSLATAGLETVALRVPFHPLCQELLHTYHAPLVAPSANKSNCVSPTSATLVRRSLGKETPYLLDGGECHVGIESTILDMTTPTPEVLRIGGVPIEALEQFFHTSVPVTLSQKIKGPGMLKRHYAPELPLRLRAIKPEEGEAFLGFGPHAPENAHLNLSEKGSLVEATKNFFSMLAALDDKRCYNGIAVMAIPSYGLGRAINDRLERAAA